MNPLRFPRTVLMKRLSSFGFVPLARAQSSQEPLEKRARPDSDPSGAAVHGVQPQLPQSPLPTNASFVQYVETAKASRGARERANACYSAIVRMRTHASLVGGVNAAPPP